MSQFLTSKDLSCRFKLFAEFTKYLLFLLLFLKKVVMFVRLLTVREMVLHPYETQSDSFYFVDEKLVMHNKADYSYNGGT